MLPQVITVLVLLICQFPLTSIKITWPPCSGPLQPATGHGKRAEAERMIADQGATRGCIRLWIDKDGREYRQVNVARTSNDYSVRRVLIFILREVRHRPELGEVWN